MLADQNFVAFRRMAKHLHRSPHALDVSVMIGSEDVDDEIPSLVLLVVVPDVGKEVGRVPIGLE